MAILPHARIKFMHRLLTRGAHCWQQQRSRHRSCSSSSSSPAADQCVVDVALTCGRVCVCTPLHSSLSLSLSPLHAAFCGAAPPPPPLPPPPPDLFSHLAYGLHIALGTESLPSPVPGSLRWISGIAPRSSAAPARSAAGASYAMIATITPLSLPSVAQPYAMH